MSGPRDVPSTRRATGLRALLEPRRVGTRTGGGAVLVYAALVAWSAFVNFPLDWLVATSPKLPIDVDPGPVYVPWVDFLPDLHAWRRLLDSSARSALAETLEPCRNPVIVAFASTAPCMPLGSMAAYALARIECEAKLGTILAFVLLTAGAATSVGVWRIDWRLAGAVALALLVLLAQASAGASGATFRTATSPSGSPPGASCRRL